MIWWSRSKFRALTLSALILSGCASSPQINPEQKVSSQEDVALAHGFFLRARSLEMEGKATAALSYYQIAFRYNSNSRDLCFLLLDRLRDAGRLDSAIAVGKTCFTLEGKPTSRQYQSLGRAHLLKGDAPPAIANYREAVQLDEEDRDALYILAGLYEKSGDAPRYAATLRRLLPQLEYPRQLVDKAVQAYRILGQPDSALEVYREAVKEHPEDHETQYAYSLLLQRQGRKEEAHSVFKNLAQSFPQSAPYQFAFGSAGLELKHSESRFALEKAVSLNPSIPDYWSRSIYADHRFGRDSAVARRLDQLPNDPFFRGLVRVQLARQIESEPDSNLSRNHRRIAAEYFRAALENNPGNHLLLFELGTNLERLGLRDSAAQTLRELVKGDTINAMAMNYLGYMLVEDSVDLDFAGGLLDRALALDPENGAYLDSKGWWHFRKGNFPAARDLLQRSLERMPDDPTVLDHLATVLERLGEKETAQALRKKNTGEKQ